MVGKALKPEQIVDKLREAEVLLSRSATDGAVGLWPTRQMALLSR
jgi:hypothetical protein